MIYLIEHRTEKFSGFFGGVDFHQGRGSTSSMADARRLANLGHRVSGLGAETVKHDTGAGGDASAPSPVDFSPAPEEAAAAAKQEEARKSQDEMERNPDSPWSQKRRERARQAAKHRRGRKT